ncbi:tRNA threonylcarbamoyladenosine dehydratase [Persicobacter psychrovividus]|uniref:tRNA threonylcarbamoyladenosine dehydratase n=1 Tax=Persicobacter psychrovividus TaxID=387638 RepID=A0ABN6LFP8_9BACT|nr:tRNA threonylcarbamoyladenosine dehydratase [Persicobacter psychrovividus]
MDNAWLERAELMLGDEKLKMLANSHVLIVGLGGVGGFATECIARAGVGKMTIVDGDTVDLSNKNRQLVALDSTVGKEKATVLGERLLDINPYLELTVVNQYLTDVEIQELLDRDQYDYVMDCIDTLTPKIFLISNCLQRKLPLVSAMGAGGKMDPSKLTVADISKSYNCKLARMLRKRLHKMGIRKGFKVVFSPEDIDTSKVHEVDGLMHKKSVIGTISYMPPMLGGMVASVVIRSLLGEKV